MEFVSGIVILIQNWVGIGLPVVIDFVNARVANSKIRFVLSVVICAVVALALNFNKVLEVNNWQDAGILAGQVSFIFAQAQIVYKLYWEKNPLRTKIIGQPVV